MASTDARPIPIKNTAFRASFPIFDADGDLVTGATGLDSEVSKDGGTFTDCTNEATEIATSSGMYYLDLTSTEMNADTVIVIVKTSTSGAKTTPIVLYPNETGDIDVDVTAWLGTAPSTPNTAGVPKVDTILWEGSDASTLSDTWVAEAGPDEADIWSYATRTVDLSSVTTLLGTPADTDLASDIANVQTAADAILTDTGTTLDTKINTIDDLLDTEVAAIKTVVDAILVDTAEIGVAGAGLTAVSTDAPSAAEVATAVLTTQMTESYAADGAAPTLTQVTLAIQQILADFSISGSTLTVKKLDGSTTALTITLNDSSSPTAAARTG